MEPVIYVLTVVAALGCGIVAGVFFAFSTFVMKALSRLSPGERVGAMQSINVVVLNPLFLSTFVGTGLTGLASAITATVADAPATILQWSGAVLYILGTFIVTLAGNVPLNDALAQVDRNAANAAEHWSRYCHAWMRWNHVRTIAAAVALILFILALPTFARSPQ